MSRLEQTLGAIDEANREDPNQVQYAGKLFPKEALHAERASDWLGKLVPEPGELLQIAVRAHHLRRWQLPRSEYPMGKKGYHAWRRELQKRHAREAGEMMAAAGYDPEAIDRVETLICKRALGRDVEAGHFEDVLCLVFLEIQLESFAAEHEAEKIVDILAKTLPKMSEQGRAVALSLSASASPAMTQLIEQAVARFSARQTGAS